MAQKKNTKKATKKSVTKKQTFSKASAKNQQSKRTAAKSPSTQKATKRTFSTSPVSSLNTKTPSIRKKQIITVLAILLIIAILYAARSLFIAAMVNGRPISRFSVISEVEKADGKKALDNLVIEQLIQQEADKRGVNVSQADVDKQISTISKNIQAQGMTLDQALAQQGMSRDDLNKQVKLQLLVNKMVKPVNVTDKEVNDYVNANKEQFPTGTTDAEMKAQAKQTLTSQKQQQETQTFVQNLQRNAKINYFVNYQ